MLEISELLDLEETITKDFFKGLTYPWEVFNGLDEKIIKLGNTLPEDRYEKRGENIWIAKSAKVAPTAFLNGPLIVDEDAEIRHCAFIRGAAVVGKGSVVGNSTELKSSILFNCVQTPHYNYVGNSILSYKNKLYNESTKNKVDKGNTFEYLKSCIIFVYEENIKDKSFLTGYSNWFTYKCISIIYGKRICSC